MADQVVESIDSPFGDRRVIIVLRADGRYSFRMQSRDSGTYSGPGVHAWPDGYVAEAGWNPPGPYLGIYDAAHTAKWEAPGKVDWLASAQPSN
jgi:hypothetical protein